MSVQSVIRYDGPALADHSMDVADLAPALLALSELLKIANTYANGDRAGVKVKVNADLEQKCFQLNIDLAQTLWEQAKLLLADDDVVAAQNLAAWVGIVRDATVAAVAGGWSLFKLIKYLRGKKVESVTVIKIEDGRNAVQIQIEGEAEPIQIAQQIYDLYANPEARKRAVEVMEPLRTEGYETLEFDQGKDNVFRIRADEVPDKGLDDLPEVIPQNLHTSNIRTGVRIRKAAYEGSAKWTLMYKRAVDAPILDEQWLALFQANKVAAPPGSSLDVDLRETYITNELGELVGEPTYEVIKVYEVTQPAMQSRLDFRDDSDA
ncbi:MAG: hypothetical protein AAF249_13250 [Pseudomonadota bacterium]